MFRLVLSLLVSSLALQGVQSAAPLHGKGTPLGRAGFHGERSNDRAQTVNYRLSGDLVPINYNISLYPRLHLKDFTFDGKVQITLRAENDASEIVLHAYQLKINDVDLVDLSTQATYILYAKDLNRTTDFLTLASAHADPLELVAGHEYLLTINYSGSLRSDNGGFYLSSYETVEDEVEYLATTQLQATDARHAFPCFDEPGYKATFDIAIRHGKEYNVVSNMPLSRTEDTSSDTTTSYFQTTPKMSTYIIAFMVSKFVSTESKQGDVLHRVFSRPDTKDEQGYALETSKKILNYFATYLDVPYDLPKIDNVAVPDFGTGAMENWGMVEYREEYLLFDEKKSTTKTMLGIAMKIGHEFTHMWFGDLVTAKWWEFLWLHEGFASLYEYLSVDAVHPEFDIMQNYIVDHFQASLNRDATQSPRAMSTYVESPSAISNVFNYVSYAKSACILRMFQHVLGESVFQKGLSAYLKAKAYDVVEEDDLFDHLIDAAKNENIPGLPTELLRKFFKSWTQQGGYPLLTVTRDYSSGTFLINQHIFDNTNDMTKVKTFYVPYNYVYGNNPDFASTRPDGFLLGLPTATVNSLGGHSQDDWLLLNKQLTGFYRVNYDDQNWKLLVNQLRKDHKVIPAVHRAQLIDDSVKLAISGHLHPSVALSLMDYLKNEVEYAPWEAMDTVFNVLNPYFLGDEDYHLLQFYIRQLVTPAYEKFGITEGSDDTLHKKQIRNLVINWACRTNAGSCLDDTNMRLNEVIDTGKDVEPNLQVAIFCNGLINGGEKEFAYIFRRILDSKDQAERRQLIPTLGCSRNATLLMEFVMTSTVYSVEINYRTQERNSILSSVIGKNEVGLLTAIEFLKDNYKDYYNLGAHGFIAGDPFTNALSGIVSRSYSQEAVNQFIELAEEMKQGLPQISSQIDSWMVRAIRNRQWVERNRDSYMSWLRSYRNSASSVILSSVTLLFATAMSLRLYF